VAKKKRKPRNRAPASAGAAASKPAAENKASAPSGSSSSRRDKKEQARAAREAERKRQARTATIRRAAVFSLAGLAAFGTLWWLQRAASPRPIPEAAVQAAAAAGCTTPTSPAGGDAPGGQHLQSGEAHTYDQHPATSGPHDPGVLPDSPKVYTQPVPETQAVHYLEHAGVLVYYRSDGDAALPADVVASLTQVVEGAKNTILAPYDGLPDGTSLALAAWDELQTCPGAISAGQAGSVAQGFIEAFECTNIAPEPKASTQC